MSGVVITEWYVGAVKYKSTVTDSTGELGTQGDKAVVGTGCGGIRSDGMAQGRWDYRT